MLTQICNVIICLSSTVVAYDGVRKPKPDDSTIKITSKAAERSEIGLWIPLRCAGKPLEKVTRIGMLKVTGLVDPKGRRIPLSRTFNNSYFVSLRSRMQRVTKGSFFGGISPRKDGSFRFAIPLGRVSRGTRAIGRATGSITFRLAKKVTVDIPVAKVKANVGGTIDNAILEKLNVAVKIVQAGDRGTAPALDAKLVMRGKGRFALLNLDILKKDGMSFGGGRYQHTKQNSRLTVYSYKNYPANAVMRLTFEEDAKDVVVPFDLRNLPITVVKKRTKKSMQ